MAKQPATSKLTDKQKLFCQEYLKDLNATQAAIRAGYSEKTAKEIAAQNLSKLNIQEHIAELQAEVRERNDITIDRVVQEIAKTAFMQESDFYHQDGSVKQLSELTDEQKAALSSYSIKRIKDGKDENGNQKYIEVPVFSAQDKSKALDMLMKHLGGYEKDNEQKKPEAIVKITREIVEPK